MGMEATREILAELKVLTHVHHLNSHLVASLPHQPHHRSRRRPRNPFEGFNDVGMIRGRRHFLLGLPLTDICLRRLRPLPGQTRPLSSPPGNSGKEVAKVDGDDGGGAMSREEAYRQVQDLDFMKAAKILFTAPPKTKKFGLDFHLVQFFFACMPSLAVYLVAQYARYEIRRMEAEAEVKKKQKEEEEEKAREEEKAKEAELRSMEEESAGAELSKVIVRLDALEEVVKEIVVEKKKTPSSISQKDQEDAKNSDSESKSRAADPKPESNKEEG